MWESDFNNLTKKECNAPYNFNYLLDDPTIIIKGADKGSAVIIWDREDYIKEASKQLEDKDVYEEVQNDPRILINTVMHGLEKIRIWDDLSNDAINYFLVKDPIFAIFYLLPKIHKRLHNVPGRPVISHYGSYCRFSYTGTWELVSLFVRTKLFSYHICYENMGWKSSKYRRPVPRILKEKLMGHFRGSKIKPS